MLKRVPAGVVGVISPFNVPLILSIRSVAPALALGNAVVLKPDLRTPVSGGFAIARVFAEAGLPEGLLHVLPGGADAGTALVADPRVRIISFTGSTSVGRKVGELAAKHLKRAHLELGGNSALVVLDDVDVERAVSAGAWGSFLHQGQICMTAGRHLVHERVAESYVEALAVHAERLPVGNPATERGRTRPAHRRGPAGQGPRPRHVHCGRRGAARGRRHARRACSTGRPCWTGSAPTCRRTPTRCSARWRRSCGSASDDEAAALAAASEYGLSLSILTR